MLGDVPSATYHTVYGYNPNIKTGGFEPIWDGSGTYSGWLEAGDTVDVQSGAAADGSGGAGTRVVTVQGLATTTWASISEDITMNGTSSVTSSGSFVRVHRVFQTDLGAGTYGGTNAGAITVDGTTSSTTLSAILTGNGQSLAALTTVPAGKVMYLDSFHIIPDSNKVMDVRMWSRNDADVVAAPFTGAILRRLYPALESPVTDDGRGLPSFAAKTDIWFDARATTAGHGCSVKFSYWLVDA